MAHEGDPAVDRDHEPEADEAKVCSLLLGVPTVSVQVIPQCF
jgi:hypothetical protein